MLSLKVESLKTSNQSDKAKQQTRFLTVQEFKIRMMMKKKNRASRVANKLPKSEVVSNRMLGPTEGLVGKPATKRKEENVFDWELSKFKYHNSDQSNYETGTNMVNEALERLSQHDTPSYNLLEELRIEKREIQIQNPSQAVIQIIQQHMHVEGYFPIPLHTISERWNKFAPVYKNGTMSLWFFQKRMPPLNSHAIQIDIPELTANLLRLTTSKELVEKWKAEAVDERKTKLWDPKYVSIMVERPEDTFKQGIPRFMNSAFKVRELDLKVLRYRVTSEQLHEWALVGTMIMGEKLHASRKPGAYGQIIDTLRDTLLRMVEDATTNHVESVEKKLKHESTKECDKMAMVNERDHVIAAYNSLQNGKLSCEIVKERVQPNKMKKTYKTAAGKGSNKETDKSKVRVGNFLDQPGNKAYHIRAANASDHSELTFLFQTIGIIEWGGEPFHQLADMAAGFDKLVAELDKGSEIDSGDNLHDLRQLAKPLTKATNTFIQANDQEVPGKDDIDVYGNRELMKFCDTPAARPAPSNSTMLHSLLEDSLRAVKEYPITITGHGDVKDDRVRPTTYSELFHTLYPDQELSPEDRTEPLRSFTIKVALYGSDNYELQVMNEVKQDYEGTRSTSQRRCDASESKRLH
jgi:hypothetical protein